MNLKVFSTGINLRCLLQELPLCTWSPVFQDQMDLDSILLGRRLLLNLGSFETYLIHMLARPEWRRCCFRGRWVHRHLPPNRTQRHCGLQHCKCSWSSCPTCSCCLYRPSLAGSGCVELEVLEDWGSGSLKVKVSAEKISLKMSLTCALWQNTVAPCSIGLIKSCD